MWLVVRREQERKMCKCIGSSSLSKMVQMLIRLKFVFLVKLFQSLLIKNIGRSMEPNVKGVRGLQLKIPVTVNRYGLQKCLELYKEK